MREKPETFTTWCERKWGRAVLAGGFRRAKSRIGSLRCRSCENIRAMGKDQKLALKILWLKQENAWIRSLGVDIQPGLKGNIAELGKRWMI